MAVNKHDKALDDCNKVMEIEPNNIKAYANRAVIYEDIGEYDKARQDYLFALSIDPNNADNSKIRDNLKDMENKIKKI
jgi:Tfp pilus assembly protein PilF